MWNSCLQRNPSIMRSISSAHYLSQPTSPTPSSPLPLHTVNPESAVPDRANPKRSTRCISELAAFTEEKGT